MTKCWMCRKKSVKQFGRCKECRLNRCIECAEPLKSFVRMIRTTTFRKRQWKNEVYDHESFKKTYTIEKLCVNPHCAKYWNPEKLPPQWQPADDLKAVKNDPVKKKTFEQAMQEVETIVQSL